MIFIFKKVPANLVPAAAVIREGQTLSKITGRIEFVDGLINYFKNVKVIFKYFNKTVKLEFINKKVEFYR